MDTPTLILPTLLEVVPHAHPDEPTDAEDIAYNAHCTALILAELERQKAAGQAPRIRTQYPKDTTEPGNDSRDILSLDAEGAIVVLDSGVR